MSDTRDWQRLAEHLSLARVRMGFRKKVTFYRHHGLTQGDIRLISDLENGKRTNYSRSTRQWVEGLYGWQPGSVDAVLAGGDPTEAPTVQAVEVPDPQDRLMVIATAIDALTDADQERILDLARRMRPRDAE